MFDIIVTLTSEARVTEQNKQTIKQKTQKNIKCFQILGSNENLRVGCPTLGFCRR